MLLQYFWVIGNFFSGNAVKLSTPCFLLGGLLVFVYLFILLIFKISSRQKAYPIFMAGPEYCNTIHRSMDV